MSGVSDAKARLMRARASLAAVIDGAREAKRLIDDALAELDAPPPGPAPSTHRFGAVIHFSDRPGDYPLKPAITAVRGWISLAADGSVKSSDLDGARAWRDAGYLVVACVHPSQPSAVNDDRIDQWAAHLTVGGAGVDLWEIANECDLGDYWPGGNWREAVTRFITPMCRALHERMPDAGIIPGALGSIAKQQLYEEAYHEALSAVRGITAGQAVHPYSTTPGDLDSKLERMARIYGVALYATEWDHARGRPDGEWFATVRECVRIIRERTAVDAFYRIRDGNPADASGRNLYGVDKRLTRYGEAYLSALRQP